MNRSRNKPLDELSDDPHVMHNNLVQKSEFEFFIELLSKHYFLGNECQHSEVSIIRTILIPCLVETHELSKEQLRKYHFIEKTFQVLKS